MTQSYPMVLTYTVPENSSETYIAGQVVRLNVPRTWGMFQANGLTARIMSVDSNANTMHLDVNSMYFDAFIDGSGSSETPASLAPAGSRNLEYNNTTNQVPFQSLNNIGN